MSALMFECPTTRHLVETGIEIDYSRLRRVQPVTVHMFCPRCKRPHEWKLSEGLISENRPLLAPWSACRIYA